MIEEIFQFIIIVIIKARLYFLRLKIVLKGLNDCIIV